MAAGEYVSVSSQADTEHADLARERARARERAGGRARGADAIYVSAASSAELARQVAAADAHDALGAHARDELGISATLSRAPVQAALTSARSFAVGAALPLVVAALSPDAVLIAFAVGAASLVLPRRPGRPRRARGRLNLGHRRGRWRVQDARPCRSRARTATTGCGVSGTRRAAPGRRDCRPPGRRSRLRGSCRARSARAPRPRLVPCLRSRTSASSAALRACRSALRSAARATCRSSSHTRSQPPLPSHSGYWISDEQGGEAAIRRRICIRRITAPDQVVERVAAGIAGDVAQLLLDAQQLVVLGHAVRARQRAGLDLQRRWCATAMSAMVVSSVSPERCEITAV